MKTYDMQVYEQRLKRDQILHNMAKKKEQRRIREAYTENTGQLYPDWAIQENLPTTFKFATKINVTKEIIDDKVTFFSPQQYPALEEWVKILENKYKEMYETDNFPPIMYSVS